MKKQTILLCIQDEDESAEIKGRLSNMELEYETVPPSQLTTAITDTPTLVFLTYADAEIDLCEKLTQIHKNKISVIFLGKKDNVKTMANAFTAGADDYLVLPCKPYLLREKIQETLAHLHNGKPEPTESSKPRTNNNFERRTENTLSEELLAVPSLKNAKLHTLESFKTLNLPNIVEIPSLKFNPEAPTLGVWATIIIPNKNLWLDILVETDVDSAEYLYKMYCKESSTSAGDAIIQIAKTIKETMQKTFASEGDEVLMPHLPQTIDSKELDALQSITLNKLQLAVGSTEVKICVSYFASERTPKFENIENLKENEITAEVIPLENSHHPLVNSGVSLDSKKLKLLKKRFVAQGKELGIRIFAPSEVAKQLKG
jgi:DNA-binding response OmpR family regulator